MTAYNSQDTKMIVDDLDKNNGIVDVSGNMMVHSPLHELVPLAALAAALLGE